MLVWVIQMKCHYCNNKATKSLVWLKDKRGFPARIRVNWCGCDLMEHLKKIYRNPYIVSQQLDYEVEEILEDRIEMLRYLKESLSVKQKEYIREVITSTEHKKDFECNPDFEFTLDSLSIEFI